MNFMNALRRRFRFQIPNLMLYITAAMLAVFALEFITGFPVSGYLYLSRNLVLRGEVWRLLTFLVIPMSNSPIWLLFSLYFYYFIGSSLESAWGSNQFTLYYLFGVLGAIAAGLITGQGSNTYLNLSLFFAFASLFPNYQILLFFFIPIKVKYLAYVNWFFFALSFLSGNRYDRMAIIFSLINYFIFFGPDIINRMQTNLRYSKSRRNFRNQMRQNRDMWR